MNNIMIDLETMSTAPDAAIVAIGAVCMNFKTGELGDTFYRTVNLKSAMRQGGKIDAETIMWWMQQSEGARKALYGDDSVLIDTALKEFAEWVRKEPLEGIWGNGAAFDNVILNQAYLRAAKTAPWSHREDRCYRTVAKLHPEIKKTNEGILHNALDDAISQAKHLCKIFISQQHLG